MEIFIAEKKLNTRCNQGKTKPLAAIEILADEAGEINFNRYTVCNLHALLSDNLLPDPGASGRIHTRPVGISGTLFHPQIVPQQIEERFEEILVKASAGLADSGRQSVMFGIKAGGSLLGDSEKTPRPAKTRRFKKRGCESWFRISSRAWRRNT
jgi:hypothetical protein